MLNRLNLLFQWLNNNNHESWAAQLSQVLPSRFCVTHHGDFPKWNALVDTLPHIDTTSLSYTNGAIQLSTPVPLTTRQQQELKSKLLGLHPWRKGPFDMFEVEIDCEWRSNLKWDRLEKSIGSLNNKTVLDIGCGNGYYMMRMLEHQPEMIIGIDSTLIYIMQFLALQKYIKADNMFALPIKMEEIPDVNHLFDTIFMMGVLYHRRNPVEDLSKIRHWLKPAGQLVLETLIIDDDSTPLLEPKDRYAQMRNVWMIPNLNTLTSWLKESGYQDIQVTDITVTSLDEQRQTEWMHFQSLKDFLDPDDSSKTVEGYPAPTRAIVIANT